MDKDLSSVLLESVILLVPSVAAPFFLLGHQTRTVPLGVTLSQITAFPAPYETELKRITSILQSWKWSRKKHFLLFVSSLLSLISQSFGGSFASLQISKGSHKYFLALQGDEYYMISFYVECKKFQLIEGKKMWVRG